MLHIDDWLDDPATGPADVKEWLDHFQRPAIDKDYQSIEHSPAHLTKGMVLVVVGKHINRAWRV